MKNENVKGFDKDSKQSSSSQFKSQDKGKKGLKAKSKSMALKAKSNETNES